MRLVPLALVAAAALAGPAPAMTVADFVAKMNGLYLRGPLFWTSPDYPLLKREGIQAADAWRAQAHAPNACPPDAGKVDIDQTEFLRMIRAVPPAERPTTSIAQAIIPPLNRRFPCL